MKKILESIKDFLYDSVDYIIMLSIVGLVVLVIGWRLEILFADDINNETSQIALKEKRESNVELNIDFGSNVGEEESKENSSEDESNEKENSEDETEVKQLIGKSEAEKKPNSQELTIEIPKGAHSTKIGQILKDNGLISDVDEFVKKSEDMKLSTKYKAGTFKLSSASTMEEIMLALSK